MDDECVRNVCAATIAKYHNQSVKLIGRIIQPCQPGLNAKVQVYAGPGSSVTVAANLESKIENLAEFVGTVTSPTTMQADSYHVFSSELSEDFDLDVYCKVLTFADTGTFKHPWSEGLA